MVDLRKKIRKCGSVKFLRVERRGGSESPFAIVYYIRDGRRQRQSLRLDMGKRTFIDDVNLSKKVNEILPDIALAVVKYAYAEKNNSRGCQTKKFSVKKGMSKFNSNLGRRSKIC
jgi:hypothetical protein